MLKLLCGYKQAWESKNVDSLRELFHTDALYYTTPFGAPLSGLSAIEEYWRTKVIPQSEIVFDVGRHVFLAPDVVFEWTATFRRADRDIDYYLCGLMVWTIKEQKITRLWEHFTKQAKNRGVI